MLVMTDEYVTVREAGELLGVSKVKMAQLLRDGVLSAQESVLDRRVKLILRADVERLAKQLRPSRRDDQAHPGE